MPRLLLFFSHKLTDEQQQAAEKTLQVTQLVYLPDDLQKQFSNVPPQLSSVADYAQPFCRWLAKEGQHKDYVLIQGDYGLTYILVKKALSLDMIPVYATTERCAKESVDADGQVKVERVFKHKLFRRYE